MLFSLYCLYTELILFHAATLTVQETLHFSADCQMRAGTTSEVRKQRVDVIMQLLGLKHRANTIVGDALLRGVSGGEKKRVTVGIEWTKSPGIWLFDEPTTGKHLADKAFAYLKYMLILMFVLDSRSGLICVV